MNNLKFFYTAVFAVCLIFNNPILHSQGTTITSTNKGITIGEGGTITYCVTDPIDIITNLSPGNKEYSGPGITDINLTDGLATFNPATAGAGNHTIRYNTKDYTFAVVAPAVPTLNPFPEYCSNSPIFTLTGGLPVHATGTYYVEGVAAATFNPIARGAGIYSVIYTVGAPGCVASSPIQTIKVNAIPVITFVQPSTPLCADATPIDLATLVSPAGGLFTGSGVVPGNKFDPASVTIPGIYTVRYTYTDPVTGCTNFAERNITVNAVPVLNITGLDVTNCEYDPDFSFSYSPVSGPGGTAVLTGNGITDMGGGNASFSPLTAGLGYHDVTFTYTTSTGCTKTQIVKVRVGTDIKITGIPSNFCQNDPVVNFNYSHWDTDPLNPPVLPHTLTISGGSGLTDLGTGSASFNPSLVAPSSYTITYRFTDDLTCVNEVNQALQVFPVPVANFSGLSTSYCQSSADVLLTGNPPNGNFTGPAASIINLGGGTATFKPSVLPAGGPYGITYTVSNTSGCTDTETKSLSINPLPAAYTLSGSGSYCQGAAGLPVTLFDSDAGVNYQLYKNGSPDGATVAGTGAALVWAGRTAGTYTVVATAAVSGCEANMNGSVVVLELAKATITIQPTDVTVCETATATFNIEATGDNVQYQWYKDGVAIGGNSKMLVLNLVPLADDGDNVYCEVTSWCGGTITSNIVTLNVDPQTVIITHPVNETRCTAGGVVFTVTANGVNLTYKWKQGAVYLADIAGKISGSNTNSLIISNLGAADEGLYSCEVTGGCGPAITSTQASLTVNQPIVITSQPVSVSACAGTPVSFSASATPAAGLTYQWYFDAAGAPVNFVATGIPAPSLPLSAVPANAGSYYCKIFNACGEERNTNPVSLSIPAATVITVSPVGDVVCAGSNLNLTVAATGDNLSYQWFRDANPVALTDDAIIHNSTTANISFTGLTPAYSGNYRVKVTGTCGEQNSAPDAVISVRQPIAISSQPVSRTICSGSDVTFSVVATGDDLTYQWQFNDLDIGPATTADYTITGASAVNAGNYRCIVSSAECGIVNSSAATLTINPITVITLNPVPLKNACVGTNVSFSVTATGVGLAYQWFKDGANLGAAYTSSTINLVNVNAGNSGSYICQVTGTCSPLQISTPGVLTIDIPAFIATHPVPASVCFGSSHELNVVLAAGTNPTYQWYFDNDLDGAFVPVGGAMAQILTINPFNAATAGDYYCRVTNGCGSVNSQTARLSLTDIFNITVPLTDLGVCENGNTILTVAADQAVSYEWSKNGIVIPGQTTSSLILNNIPLADNGAVYSCRIYNNCITRVTSATLTVSEPLSITQQPLGGIACIGSPYSIIVVASGTNPSYQWYKAPAVLLPGKTGSALSFAPFAAIDAGTYYCIVTNACGSVQTGNAVITAGTITTVTNPVAIQLCTGDDAVFAVTATGQNLVYEWRKNYVLLVDDGRITGSNTNTLTIKDIVAGDEETYDIIVTGTCGLPVTSAGAFLEVTTPPSIITNPVPQTICSGGNASFSVTVASVVSDPPPTYRWKLNDVLIDIVANPSAATSTLSLPGAVTGGIYNCVVTNSCGSVTSTSAELIIENNINILSHPAPAQTKCEGSNVTFIASITGPTDMTLQWYKDDGTPTGQMLVNGGRISGVNLPTLTINNVVAGDAGSYFCRATGLCGTSVTNSGTLTVQSRIAITQQPQGLTVCPGGTLTLSTIATGSITNYQWKYFNGVITVNVGTNSPVYSVSPFAATTHAGTYTCELTNICETVVSDAAVVTAGAPTTAAISADIIQCEGANATFTIAASGSNLLYKWYHGAVLLSDNARIGGSNSATLNISGLVPADAGTYQCEVTGSCGFDNDNAAVLTVNRNISFDVQPVSTSALIGTTGTFTVVASGSITGYQWYKGATLLSDIAGETSGTNTPTLSVLNAQPVLDEGSYSCVIIGICGNRTSNSATLTVIPASAITVQPATPINVCQGLPISISITTSGAGHTYQWRRDATTLVNGGSVSGATSASLTIAASIPGDAGAYTCLVDGSEISSASIVTINPSTAITTHPTGGTKCTGDVHIFSVAATGAGLAYQWYKNDLSSAIGGATSADYTISPVSVADNGSYFCVVTGTCGPQTSSPATLVVNNPVTITSQPVAPPPLCEGTSTSLTFGVSGSGLSYLWKKNGQPVTDPNISGTTSATLVITNSIVANAGVFSCTVTGLCSTPVTSDNAAITVNPATSITLQPVGRNTCEGDAVTFTVAATGANLSYDWRRNGVSLGIPAPGSPSLTINGLLTASHEGTYTCVVTGTCGAPVTSLPAILTVNRITTIGAPVISANPICQDASTRITIAASGDGITYLWKKSGQPITSANITGINTNELVISNAQVTDAGVYTCSVSGLCGSPLTSTNAVITVNPTTVITTQPLNYTKCAGDEVILNVVATGSITVYQWLKGAIPLSDGVQPSGAVVTGSGTPQLRIANLTTTEAASYTCAITGACGNVISTPAALSVNVPVQITAEPPALTQICQGSSTSITVTTSGTVTSFRWKKDGNYLSNGGSFSGVTSDKLVISNALLADAGFYSCEIVSDCNTTNTQSAELRVNPLTAITMQPSNASLCEGENVQFMVTATGGLPLTYEWRFNNIGIPGASFNILVINGINTLNAGAYTCYITSASGCGTITSNPANLTVNPGASIVTQPANTAVCEGSTAILSVAATGTAPLTYRWKYNNVYMTNGGRISGASSNELRISGSVDADEGIYKCEIVSPCGTIETSSVTLTVDPTTVITIHPANQSIVQGTTAVFSVAANGIITGYQWEKDGSPLVDGGDISGATTAILRVADIAVADAGSYRCVVTGKCGNLTSNPGILTVNVPVVITLSPADQTACSGGSASFNVVASGSIVSYRWMFNGAPLADGAGIDGSGTPNLVISSVTGATEGNYTCVVTGTFNTANSSIASLIVTEPVDLTIQPITQTLCLHDWLVLEVTATGENLSYAWEKDGVLLGADANTTGINSALLVITDVTVARAGSYRCRVWNSCNDELSNAAVITINPAMTLVTSPVNDTKCEGQNTTFSALASGVNLSYQWYKGGMLLANSARVTGATSGNLTINGVQLSDQDSYSCTITDNCNTISSASATLTVKEKVVITQQPQNMTLCEGQNAFFEVRATGFNLNYQWQKDGVDISDGGNISGTTTSVLVINSVAFADRGVYRCLVTGDCNNILTNTAGLTVNLLPAAAGTVSGSQLICQGAVRVLYVVPAIANAAGYVWTLPYGAVIVSGSGTRSIEVDYPVGSLSGVVSVHGVNGCANGAESPALPVTVNPLPLAAAGADQILCTDATTLAADATGYIPGSGIWTRISGQGVITNPAVPNSGLTGVGQGENVFRWTVTLAGCTSYDEVKITNRLVTVNAGIDQTICSMSAVLAANSPSAGSGSWSIVTGGGTFSNMADPHASVINLTRGANTFRWSINNGGCISFDDVIIINDLPTNSDAGVDAILVVDNYTLAANIPVIGTGRWTLISGSATITNPNLNNTTVTGLGIGDNIFRWTITNNLCMSQDEVKVTNFTPTVTDAGPDQTLCFDRASLTGTKPNYGTGQWSVVAGSGTFVDPYKWDTEVFNIGKGTNRYKWTVYEYMVTSDEVTIINNSPSSANAGIDQRLCVTNATLAANNPMIGTGVWSVVGGSGTVANTALFNSAVSNLGSGANTFRWTVTNGGCSSYDEINIVNDQPTFAEAGGDQVICADSVNLYPNTPTIGSGEWSVVSGSAFFRGNKAYNLARGENRFAWTITNSTCSHTDIVSITSNKPTTAYTGADKSICVDNITLPGNTPTYGTGVWTILSGSGYIENTGYATSPVTNLAPGSNRFRWTITYNGCVSFDEVAISYDFIPANAGTDQVLCLPGAILNATDAGVGSGQWSVVGGSGSANFTNPNQSNTEVNGLDRGMNMLRWTVTNAGCVSSDDVVITNNSPSTAYAGSDRSVCGEEILLNANTPLVGTAEWSILGGSAVIASPTLSNSRVSNLSIGRNVLRWTVTHLGCVSYDEVVINNDQPTNIEAGPSQFICADNTQLYATAPVVGYGRWSILRGSATFEDNTLYNTRITNLGKGENMLIWTVTSGGCSNHDSVSVVNNLPSVPNAGPDLDICADNVFMSANQPSIGAGRWSVVSGSATFENSGSPNSKANLLGNGPNVLRWTISNGSCTIFDEVMVLNSLPTVAYAGEDRSVCNTTANLLATNPAIGTGSWSVVSGSGILGDAGAYNSQIANLGFGQNTLRWTTNNGRCSTSDDVIITNNLAEVDAGPDQVVYKPTARLIGNKPLKGTGQWVALAGVGVVQNPASFETSVTGLGGGANSFAWTINNEGCIASDQVVINHRLMPVADFEPLPAGGCPPLEVSFVNTSVGGAPYRWDFGDGTSSAATNTSHTYNLAGDYKVRLTATGPDGFLVHKDTIIKVRELPVARFEITPDTAFIPGNSINFFNLSSNADSIMWEFGDGNTSYEKSPAYKYEETGSYNVTLHVWSEYKCYDSQVVNDAVFVELAGVINCPNAFTPNISGPSGGNFNNNDFSNDIFHCYIDGAATYHMEIYNRLGIRLFETNDINIGWDGYFKGKLVEEGAYVFKVVGKFNNGQQFNYFGNILVIY